MSKQAFGRKKRKQPMVRRGGRNVPAFFLGGLFGGASSGSQTQTTSGSANVSVDPGGGYYPLMQNVFGAATGLVNRPYEAYDPSQRFEGFTQDQLDAFQGVRNNQGAYQGNFNAAQNQYNAAGQAAAGVGTAGQSAFNAAATGTTGSAAASPYLNSAAGSWTDSGTADAWMSPYMDSVTNRIAELGNRNLMENILPGVNDTFTGGGAAQFGRERHADITGRAIRDTQESILGQQSAALNQGYQQAQTAFGNEQNRLAGIGATSGQLAQGDRSTNINLGTAQTNAAAQGVQSQLGVGQQQQGLGLARQQAGYTDANALNAAGAQQQAFGQQQRDFDYQQNREAFNYPYTNLSNIKNIGTGWQLPTQSYSQSTTTGTGTPASGSTAGNVAGGLLAVGSMGTGGGSTVGGDVMNYIGKAFVAEGGHIKGKRAFGAGGYAPVVQGMRARQQRRQPAQQMRMQALQGMGQQNPGLMPPRPLAFGKGGKVTPVAAVHKHERNMHKGRKLTAFAGGGVVNDLLLDELGYGGQFLRGRHDGATPEQLVDRPGPNSEPYSTWEPPSAFGRAVHDAGNFGRRVLEEFPNTLYEMLPTVAYDSMAQAFGRLPDSIGRGDPWDITGDSAEALLGLLNFTPGAVAGMATSAGAGRKLARGARDYLRSAFGR